MGLIFMGWLYLNPPPADNENINSENPVVSDSISTEERFKKVAETKTKNPTIPKSQSQLNHWQISYA